MKFKSVHELFKLLKYYKLRKVPSYETRSYYIFPFYIENVCRGGDSNRSKSSYETVLYSYI
jgi:hypothetical protein